MPARTTAPNTIYLVDKDTAPTLFIDVLGRVATRIEDVTVEEFAQSAGLTEAVMEHGHDIDSILPIRVEEMQDAAALKRKIDEHFQSIYYPANAKHLELNFEPSLSTAQAERINAAHQRNEILVMDVVYAQMGAAMFESKGMDVPDNIRLLIALGQSLGQRLPDKQLKTDADVHHYLMGYEECLVTDAALPQDIATVKEMGRLSMAQKAADLTLNEVVETFTRVRGAEFKDGNRPEEITILERFNAGLGRIEPVQKELFEYTAFNAMVLLGTNPEAHIDSIIIERDHETNNLLGMQMREHYGRDATIAISGKSLLREDKAFGDLTIAEEVGHYLDKITGNITHDDELYNFSYMHFDRAIRQDCNRLTQLAEQPEAQGNAEINRALEAQIQLLPQDSYLRRRAASVAATEGREELAVAREQLLGHLNTIYNAPGYENLTGLLGRTDLNDQEMMGLNTLASEWMIKLSAFKQLLVGSEGQGRAEADALIHIALPPTSRTVEYVPGEPTVLYNLSGLLDAFKAEAVEVIQQFKNARERGEFSPLQPRSTAGDSSAGIDDVAQNERRDMELHKKIR